MPNALIWQAEHQYRANGKRVVFVFLQRAFDWSIARLLAEEFELTMTDVEKLTLVLKLDGTPPPDDGPDRETEVSLCGS